MRFSYRGMRLQGSWVVAGVPVKLRVNFYKFRVLDRGGWSSLPLSAVTADVTTRGGQGGHGSPLKVPSAVTADGSSSVRGLLNTGVFVSPWVNFSELPG